VTKSWIIGGGAAAVLIGGYLATVAFLGAEIGDPCDKEWGCKGFDAVCLEGDAPLCSRHCESAAECPTGWACESVQVLTFDGKSEQPEESSTPVCLPQSN
jgi:hypothetical protein